LSKKLVTGVTGLVVLGGAGGALAATQGSTTQSSSVARSQAYVNDLAGRLSVTPSTLIAAVKATDSDQLNAAVAAGRLTQAQATAAEQRIQSSTGVPFYGAAFASRGVRARLGHGEAVAAQYLGITETTLRSDQRAGKSLATIATATAGRSVAGLKAAIVVAETARLNTAVSSGRITTQQEQERLAGLSSRIDTLLQRTWTPGAHGGRAHRSLRF
jgi:hypothetical protein